MNPWRTKYQMQWLKDDEWFNSRDGKIYIIKNGEFILKGKKENK